MNMKELIELITTLLRDQRPDRFAMRGDVEANEVVAPDDIETIEWLDEVAALVEPFIPEGAVRQLLARKLVGDQEGQLCRSVNNQFRHYHRTGQWPLSTEPDWIGQCKDDPLAVVSRSYQQGARPKVLHEHVALRAVTSSDLRKFAEEERRRASQEHAAREEACSGAEEIADEMDEAGFVLWIEWASSR